jgi:MFS family permease
MLARIRRLHPFTTPEGRRLAVLFAIVYFAQGMWYLPNQAIMIVLKDAGYSAGRVANFFVVGGAPWLLKPMYGLLSDFVPLFGRRRLSYLVLSSSVAAAAGFVLGLADTREYWPLLVLFTVMGLGLAFTDVLADALMVENGRRLNLTGSFQSVQWASLYTCSVLVGLVGGWLAERRSLSIAFLVAACFPLLSLVVAVRGVREPRARADREALTARLRAVRAALGAREVWAVASFIFLFLFSPSFGPGFLYYQTDHLAFSQQFIGILNALQALGSVAGALSYPVMTRGWPLRRTINVSIGLSVAITLVYLLYRGMVSAVIIDFTYGWVYMVTTLALLELAAKSCPPHIEGTFFALLMSVYNAGAQGSQWAGGHLYDVLGFGPLVLVSTATTALIWVLVPLVPIDAIEARARTTATPAP